MENINIIKTVKVFESKSNYHNGEDIGSGFVVIVDPMPTTGHQKWQVAQATKYALENLILEDE